MQPQAREEIKGSSYECANSITRFIVRKIITHLETHYDYILQNSRAVTINSPHLPDPDPEGNRLLRLLINAHRRSFIEGLRILEQQMIVNREEVHNPTESTSSSSSTTTSETTNQSQPTEKVEHNGS
jgi:hypothetical protein